MTDSTRTNKRVTQKPKLLLVDDNHANLIALSAVLDSPEYELVESFSGIEAVKLCDEQEFALIVLDVHMPGLDGFETAKRIKASGKNTDVPIIFVTATYREDPACKRGFEVGAIDYFGKPFDPDILKAKVAIYTNLYLKTKRLEETEQLLKTHAQIKTLLEAMPVGVIIADNQGHIYESNEEARKIWGGMPDDGFGEYEAISRALADGQTSKEEHIDIEALDGVKKSILSSAYPIRAKDGTILGAVAIMQDITVRRNIADDFVTGAKQLINDLYSRT